MSSRTPKPYVSLMEGRGTGMNRGSPMSFDDDVWYAVMAKQSRHRQPDKTSADDQDRDLFVH